jgi:hypothetical protein
MCRTIRYRFRRFLLGGMLIGSTAVAQVKTTTYAQGQLVVLPSEAVLINRFGVYPPKIVRPEGPFVLFIENRLPGHSEHFSLGPDQNGAPELLGMDTGPQKFRNSILVDLQPGKYRVHFRNNPGVSVPIEIKPK